MFTACLHWPDVDTRRLPGPGWSWDEGCTSIVNSDGVAADPLRKLVRRGGALRTPAARTPADLAAVVGRAWEAMTPGANYRTHLTVTARPPGLSTDLASCRRIVAYTRMHLPNVWPAIDPLEGLLHRSATERDAGQARTYMDTVVRPVRRAMLGGARHQVRLAATTVDQFVAAAAGEPPEALELRYDGSLRMSSLAAPRGPRQFQAAVEFVEAWIGAALVNGDPLKVVARFASRMGRQQAFDPALEDGWRRTNVATNARDAVAERLSGRRAPPRQASVT